MDPELYGRDAGNAGSGIMPGKGDSRIYQERNNTENVASLINIFDFIDFMGRSATVICRCYLCDLNQLSLLADSLATTRDCVQ